MRMTRIAAIALTLATFGATNALAQSVNIKPGLWQLDMTMPGQAKGNPMAGYVEQMKKQMASMAPEQRKEMAKVLADLEARDMQFTGDRLTTKLCITKEDIAKFDLIGKKGADTCTRKDTPVPGGMRMTMDCARPQMKVEGSVKFQSEKAYSFESTTTTAGPDGKMMTQKSSGTSQWLGSDCGNVSSASAKQ